MARARISARAWTLTALTALATCLAATSTVDAAPIDTTQLDGPLRSITYSTSVSYDTYGSAWQPFPGVTFEGVRNQTIESAAPFRKDSYPGVLPDGATVDFPLGKLVVDLPTEGERTGGGSFGLHVRIDAIDGVALDQPITVVMQGDVFGTLRAEGESELRYGVLGYSIHPPYTPPMSVAGTFQIDDLLHTVLIPDAAYGLVTLNADQTFSLDGRLISALAYNTPEPATYLLFLAVPLILAAKTRRRAG